MGGGNTMINASFIALNCLFKIVQGHLSDKSGQRRSLKGFKVIKTTPALDELVKPLIETPGKQLHGQCQVF